MQGGTLSTRLQRAASLSVVVLMLVASVAPARGARAGACTGTTRAGGWRTIAAPVPVRAFTVDAAAGLVVAGDSSLMSSHDGGCTWRTLLELAASVLPGERFTALASLDGTLVAATTGPHVLVSRDGGATWAPGDDGLDLPGEPTGLYAAPSGGAIYLALRQKVSDDLLPAAGVPEQGAGVLVTVLYRSADGGATWERRGDPGVAWTGPHGSEIDGSLSPGALWDLAVDPLHPGHLLAASKGGVFRSLDAGGKWAPVVFSPVAEVRTVALAHSPGGPARAVAVDPRSGTLYGTNDLERGWSASVHPQLRTEHMAAYPDAEQWAWSAFDSSGGALLSGPKGVFQLVPGGLADVSPPVSGGAVADLRAFGDELWGRSLDGSALLVRTQVAPDERSRPGATSSLGPHVPGGGAPPSISAPRVDAGSARLDPARRTVTLDAGEARTVRVVGRLGPRPAAVDVYFLVDATSSMADALRSLTRGMEEIVTRLARSGIRLRAGIGAFRSYPRETDRQVHDFAYRRIRGLGPVDDDLVRSLYELEGAGSSGANLTALYQAVTGAGQDVLPPGPSKADVPAGLDAGFRDGATKVVVHFADTWFGTPERGDPNGYYAPGTWPGPPFDAVAAALRTRSVRHLGVALQPSGGGTFLADGDVTSDLRRLSRDTSSLAGERGADCDGDGEDDVSADDPLVCLLERNADASGLAAVVVGLLEALEMRGEVELVEKGASGLVTAVDPPVYPGLDLRARHALAFDVTVACPREGGPLSTPVHLGLHARDVEVAAATLTVACRPLPVPPKPPSPEVDPRVALIPPIPAPPPPPHSVPGPGPGSVTAPAPVQAPAPAQAPGGQPQSVAVAQRQQQPQMAFVAAAQQVRAQAQMQHAMVRTSGRAPLAEVKLWTAFGALSVVWAWGLATSVSPSRRRQHVRRSA